MIIDSLEKHAVISKLIMKNEVPRKFLKYILLSTQHLQNMNTKKDFHQEQKIWIRLTQFLPCVILERRLKP